MMRSQWQRSRSLENNTPNFKAIPLRWPFLTFLFLLICSMLAVLEWLVRTLPNEQDRDKVPQDFASPIWKRHIEVGDQPGPSASHPRTLGQDVMPISTTTMHSSPNTTTTAEPRTTHFPRDSRLGPAANIKVPRPCDTCYPNTEPIRTYLTWANQWVGDRENPFARRPVIPGEDTSGMCVFKYQGVIMTDDPSACLAVIGPGSGTYNIPVGWTRATWLSEDIWFPPGGCDEMYDDWYSAYPSIKKFSWEESHDNDSRYPDQIIQGPKFLTFLHVLEQPFLGCTNYAGPVRRAITIPATTTAPSSSILFVYFGAFFNRYEDGRINWNQPGEALDGPRFYCTQARHTPKGYYFLKVPYIARISTPSRTPATTTAAVIITTTSGSATRVTPSFTQFSISSGSTSTTLATSQSVGTAQSSGTSSTSSTSNTSSSHASEVLSATSSSKSTTSSSSTSHTEVPGPSEVTFVNIPVYTEIYTEIRSTLSGTIRTTITTQFATSQTVLVQLPAIMVPATTLTSTDSLGSPTTITTVPGDALLRTIVTVTTNPLGSPTTLTTAIPATSLVITQTDPLGAPTATITTYPVFPHIPGSTPAEITLPSSSLTYLTVYFLPLILTALLLIPIQSIDAEIKLLLPFRSLAQPGGSTRALTMRTGGLTGIWNRVVLLWKERDPLSVVSDLIVVLSAVLVSLSGETVGLKLRGNCIKQNLNTCFITLAVFRTPARFAEVLLALLAGLVAVMMWCLARQKTGVATHPGSVSAVCVLLQVKEVREAVKGVRVSCAEGSLDGNLRKGLAEKRFFLGRLVGERRAEEYGIVPVDAGRPLGVKWGLKRAVPLRGRDKEEEEKWLRVEMKERVVQGSVLFLLVGLLTLILYYENVVFEDPTMNAFEWFMDSQDFGVNMLFTGLGVLIQFVWEDFFYNFFKMNTYRRMALRPQDARHSVLEERATNVFTGLWRALRQREPLAGAMAFTTFLSKLLPLFLSGVPFATAQTFYAHEICTWGSVALLIIMIIVLIAHMWLVKWPYMPVSLESLAGCIYYVCDSAMLADYERLSMLDERERNLRVQRMGRKYRFGWMTGLSGERRVAVDYAEGETGYQLKSLGPQGFGVGGKIQGK